MDSRNLQRGRQPKISTVSPPTDRQQFERSCSALVSTNRIVAARCIPPRRISGRATQRTGRSEAGPGALEVRHRVYQAGYRLQQIGRARVHDAIDRAQPGKPLFLVATNQRIQQSMDMDQQ